jgi:hypothetical protein
MFSVSVVIPAYNAQKWIGRAIESVLNQSVAAAEILVVDDGSTDGTAEAVKKYGSPVRYIHQANAGAGAARNKGIEAATGEWIAFLDADDEWYPHKLASQIAILSRYPHLRWCACAHDVQMASKSERRGAGYRSSRELARHGFFPNALRATRRDSLFHTMLVHRSVFASVGLFDASLRQAQDNDLWRRIAMQYLPVGYCPYPCHLYHMEIPGSVAKGNKSIPCNFMSLAKNLPVARERPPEVRDEFFRLARAMAFRRLVSLPFKRPDLMGPTYQEYLGVVPLSKAALVFLKILRLLPDPLGRRVEGRIRHLNHLWNRWY